MPSYTLKVNGQARTITVAADTPLLWALRDNLDLIGTKYGCGMGLCGACTVHLNGVAVRSCQTPVSAVGNTPVTTIEGLDPTGSHPLQKAWCDHDVPQCGYCQTGQIMTAAAFLKSTPHPSDPEIDAAMAGNLCRCGTYIRIRAAIKDAAVGNTSQKLSLRGDRLQPGDAAIHLDRHGGQCPPRDDKTDYSTAQHVTTEGVA